MARIIGKIIKFSLYLLTFLLPLFCLPFSSEAYEFNKQYLLFFLVSIGFLAWLVKMVLIDKEILFHKSILDILVLIFLLVAVVSAILSVDKNSSLFGSYGRFSDGLIGLLCLGMLYFLIINNPETKFKTQDRKEAQKNIQGLTFSKGLLKVFLCSVFFVVLISYLSIFGAWEKVNVSFGQKLPLFILQRTFNPISGSLEGLAVFLSIIIVLVTCLCLEPCFEKVWMMILLFMSLGLLIIIDFNPSWIILAFSLILSLILALRIRIFRESGNQFLLPIFLIIISILFLLTDIRSQGALFNLPQEKVLGQGISWEIAFSTIKENFKNIFFGSGIGTWYYDFSKQKPAEFIRGPLWSVKFDRAGSYIFEIFGTMGILGIIFYLALIGAFFLFFWFLRQNSESFPYAMTFLALLIGQFVYYQNTVLAFLFWFILGLAVASWQFSIKKSWWRVSLADFPEMNLVFSAVLIIFCFLFLVSCYFAARFYLADVDYTKSKISSSIDEEVSFLERAVELSPRSVYRIMLAKAYLSQTLAKLESLSEQDTEKIRIGIGRAVAQAKKAVEISPNNVSAWETLGAVYGDIKALVTDGDKWAIQSFQKALELERINPALYTEIGKLYFSSGDIAKAKESFVKAKELKPDYLDALIQEALVYEAEDNLDEAIRKMEELVKYYPLNVETRFQLGRLYFNNNDIDKAISLFEIVTRINPNHSNALYSLGVAYEQKGEKEKAIIAFERVLILNPNNLDVIQRLNKLKGQ